MTNTHGLHPDSLRNAAKLKGHYPDHQLSLPSPKKFGIVAFSLFASLMTIGVIAGQDNGEFKVTSGNVAMLALDCANKEIKPILKDPNSFREIRHGYNKDAVNIDVTVEYTATNGFGGRVRNNHTCTYTL